jgi:hypothetical protein
MAIWKILWPFGIIYVWPFGIVCGNLLYFSQFGMFGPRKIWQPWSLRAEKCWNHVFLLFNFFCELVVFSLEMKLLHFLQVIVANSDPGKCWSLLCTRDCCLKRKHLCCNHRFQSHLISYILPAHARGQLLTTWFAPRGELGPQRWTLFPWGNVHPFVFPRGWTLLPRMGDRKFHP